MPQPVPPRKRGNTISEIPRNDPARAIAWAREHAPIDGQVISILLQFQDKPNPELRAALQEFSSGKSGEAPF